MDEPDEPGREPWWPLDWRPGGAYPATSYVNNHPVISRIRRYSGSNLTVFDCEKVSLTNTIWEPFRAIQATDDLTIRCVLMELAHGQDEA